MDWWCNFHMWDTSLAVMTWVAAWREDFDPEAYPGVVQGARTYLLNLAEQKLFEKCIFIVKWLNISPKWVILRSNLQKLLAFPGSPAARDSAPGPPAKISGSAPITGHFTVSLRAAMSLLRSRTSWRDRVDAGQLATTDLTLKTSWLWVRLDVGDILTPKIRNRLLYVNQHRFPYYTRRHVQPTARGPNAAPRQNLWPSKICEFENLNDPFKT